MEMSAQAPVISTKIVHSDPNTYLFLCGVQYRHAAVAPRKHKSLSVSTGKIFVITYIRMVCKEMFWFL